MSKSLQQEGNQTKHLLNRFSFLPEDLPESIENDIEALKLHMIHKPIEIQVCGMFLLNYFILFAVCHSCMR